MPKKNPEYPGYPIGGDPESKDRPADYVAKIEIWTHIHKWTSKWLTAFLLKVLHFHFHDVTSVRVTVTPKGKKETR